MSFSVTILGSASAKPTPNRHPSAQIVNVNEQYFLVDAGEGVQQQMFRYGINPLKIRAVFISHLHGDHVYGLFPLISTLALYGKKTPLPIFGPAPLGEMLENHLRYFDPELPYAIEWQPVDTTRHALIMEDRSLSVWSIPLKHRIPCCGYLFAEKPKEAHIIREMIDFYQVPIRQIQGIKRGADFITPEGEVIPNARLTRPAEQPKRYAFCSDTAFHPEIVPYVEGVDLLYHEATFAERDLARAKETFHSTARQAATIACEAGVKRLVIGHYSARYENTAFLLDEAREVFPETILGNEGMVLSV